MNDRGGLLHRNVRSILEEALESSRVVFLSGPRQAGKTTLARAVAAELAAEYQTLDDLQARSLALDDPEEFVDRSGLLVIDEIQRGGDDLLLAIKSRVDRDPRAGQFLLTGSTRFLSAPNLSESLAGRVDLIDLWPLSQGELVGVKESFVDQLFSPTKSLRRLRPTAISRAEAFRRVCSGGFPEVVDAVARRRSRWFKSYIATLTQRDVGEIANIQRIDDLAGMVRLLATRTSSELNLSSLANELDVPRTTLAGYLPLLESVFLLFRIPSWSRNLTSKRVKQAKLHFVDSGLAAHLLGTSPEKLAEPRAALAGALLETFAVSEIARQASWADLDVELHHFRDRAGAEVDLVLEARDGRVTALEVKAGRSVGRNDLRSIKWLRDRLGSQFVNGVVLTCGETVQPLGDRLTAMPLSALWSASEVE